MAKNVQGLVEMKACFSAISEVKGIEYKKLKIFIPLTKVVFKAIIAAMNTPLYHFDWSNLLRNKNQ